MEYQTPAGWFEDPWNTSQLRYWDGNQWTGRTRSRHEHREPASHGAHAAVVEAADYEADEDRDYVGYDPLEPDRPRSARVLVVFLIVLVVAAGIIGIAFVTTGGEEEEGDLAADVSAECRSAVEDAAAASDAGYPQAALVTAFTACTSVDEWTAATREHSDLVGGDDAAAYVKNQCQFVAELAPTPLCQAASE